MKKIGSFIAVMVLGASLQTPVQAVGIADFVGVWQCALGVQSFGNQKLPTTTVNFNMQLLQNGTMYVEGSRNGTPIRAEARWQIDQQGRFSSAGQMQDIGGLTPWQFSTIVTSVTTMNENNIDNNTQTQMSSQCQKFQQ